jgi:hypothetical protein
MSPPRWLVYTSIVALLIVSTVGVVGGATGEYDLTMDSTVEVPERTIESPENDDKEYTITTVGRTAVGSNTTVHVSPPIESRYSVFFRNQDGDNIDYTRTQGDQEIEFDTESQAAGSYVITAGETSDPNTVLPVVVEGYTVDSLTLGGEPLADQTISTDSSQNLTVQLSEHTDKSISAVTVTLWTSEQGVVHEIPLESTSGDTETFEGTLSNPDSGEYNVQVRIRGGDTTNGESELMGLSDNDPLTVESASTDDDGSTGDSSTGHDSSSTDGSGTDSGGSNGGTGTDDGDNSTNGTDSENSTGNGTDTGANNGTDTGSGDEHNGTDTGSGDGDSTTDSSDSDSDGAGDGGSNGSQSSGTTDGDGSSGVIEPSLNGSDSQTDDSTPLGILPALLALALTTVYLRRGQN